MLRWPVRYIASNRQNNSIASHFRRRRLEFFVRLLRSIPRPITILDVGGDARSWNILGFNEAGITIVLLNLRAEFVDTSRFKSIVGDARNLRDFRDKSIDVVYSNSVIEHVGTLADQRRMAEEIRRVGQRYFVQTPNVLFPIEAHSLIPGFQFMPLALRTYLLTKFRLGWLEREPDPARARELLESIRLLSLTELRSLFPSASFYEERCLGLTKSIIAYYGW